MGGVQGDGKAEALGSGLRGPIVESFSASGWSSILSPQRDVPMVALRILVPGGSFEDPPGKEGLAYVTAQLLVEGTRNKRAEMLHEELDRMGGHFFVDVNGDYTMLGVSVLAKDQGRALELLVEMLREPAFPKREFNRRKQRVLGEIASQEDRPGGLAYRAFLKALWGERGYGHDPRGFKGSVRGLGLEDVMEHHLERILSRHVLVVAVGDLEPDQFQGRLSELMAGWHGREGPQHWDLPGELAGGTRVVIHRELPQATVLLGQKSVPRDHPDMHALLVMNYILGGGGFASRLMEQIRSRRGLAYAVFSSLDGRKRGGMFQVAFQTENPNVLEALDIVLEEAKRMRLERVGSKELDEGKGYLIGSFPMRLDSSSSIATSLALWDFYGLGMDYPRVFASSVQTVDQETVLRVAQEHLRPETWLQVMVGDSKAMGA